MDSRSNSPIIIDEKPKITRGKFFVDKEDFVIIKAHAKHRNVLDSALNYNKKVTLKEKDAIWTKITAEVNALGYHHRAQDQVRGRWKNMFQEYKIQKRSTKKTGGGPAPEYKQFMKYIDDCEFTHTVVTGVAGGGFEAGNGKPYDPMLTSALELEDTNDKSFASDSVDTGGGGTSYSKHEYRHSDISLGSFDDSEFPKFSGINSAMTNENANVRTGTGTASLKRKNSVCGSLDEKVLNTASCIEFQNNVALNTIAKKEVEPIHKDKQSGKSNDKIQPKSVAISVAQRAELSIEVLEMERTATSLKLANEQKRSLLLDIEIENAKLNTRKIKVQSSFWKIAFDDRVRDRVDAAANGNLQYVMFQNVAHEEEITDENMEQLLSNCKPAFETDSRQGAK